MDNLHAQQRSKGNRDNSKCQRGQPQRRQKLQHSRQQVLVRPPPVKVSPVSFFFVGSLAAQHRRLPNGGGQQQAQRRRAQKWWLAAPRETRTSRPPGGEGGRRHTLPAKEGQALAPPGLPIAQRRHTSAWQRWKKQRRKTANICSGLVRGPALIEGKRLETRGIKVRPRCWQPTAT